MKKILLLLAIAFTASALPAQNNDMYSVMYHDKQGLPFVNEGLLQQRDGDFIINTFAFEDTNTYDEAPLGNMFYKMSPVSLTFTDSLFIADTTMVSLRCYHLDHNPNGEGNILSYFKYHEDCDSCFLHIYHFTDNNLTPIEDVVAPVCEGYAFGKVSIVDRLGDIILQYNKSDALNVYEYVARFGLDGTLKCHVGLNGNEPVTYSAGQLSVLKEYPLTYYQWGEAGTFNDSHENFIIYTLDSVFNRNPVIISSKISTANEYIQYDGETKVIPVGGDNVLVAAKYTHEVNPQNPMQDEFGVVVAKYDLRTMQPKGYITFNDYPGINGKGKCLGIKMMTDGTVYFLYKEKGYPQESFVAVKMDTDLNVEWKRFFKTDNISIEWLESPVLCKDEQGEEKGIAWIGDGHTSENIYGHPVIFFYFNHDGTVGANETSIEFRPYCYYPNPAKEQLHIQFSPDVQPAQVELYDLHGRLVHKQNNAYESIDLSQLPAGTYTLCVTLEEGKTYSDKVVKK